MNDQVTTIGEEFHKIRRHSYWIPSGVLWKGDAFLQYSRYWPLDSVFASTNGLGGTETPLSFLNFWTVDEVP